MRALAIETSGRVGSLALVADGMIVGEETFPHGLRHAAEMLPRIDQLLKAQNWTPAQLGEIYVSIGAGSFTGLRLGVTLAKTFAWATGAKLVAVPSMRVLAENAPESARHVLIVLDARRGQILSARFEKVDNRWDQREPAHLDQLADALRRTPRPICLLGDGLDVHTAPVEADVLITPAALWLPRASTVARLGMAMARVGEFTPPQRLLPLYFRKPEAEEKWDNRANS